MERSTGGAGTALAQIRASLKRGAFAVAAGAAIATAALTALAATPQQALAATPVLQLRYTSAAASSYDGWEKWSLPLGNGGIGASVFGGVESDRIQLNEKSLWSGGPAAGRDYNGGNIQSKGQNGQSIRQVQEAFRAGNTSQAKSLADSLLVGVSDDAGTQGYGYYLSYGNMYLDFEGLGGTTTGYERSLDIDSALADVSFTKDGTAYERHSFVSYPDNVLVTRLTADGAGKLSLTVRIKPDNEKGGGANNPAASSYQRTWTSATKDGMITVSGQLSDNQMKFASITKVIAEDGTVTDGAGGSNAEGTATVKNASAVTIITSIGTDYKNVYPAYRTGETAAQMADRVQGYVTRAAEKGYDALLRAHVADYRGIFDRVELDLGQKATDRSTDNLLNAYKNGTASATERRYLEVLLFQYGRFLAIESSRETPADDPSRQTLPSNLQGIWTGGNNSAWHADYHLNVNLQMNYWPAYSTNMAETAEPLVNYVESLRAPGRVTAAIYASIQSTEENPENGFMAHTQNTPFGWTAPGWAFSWGWSPAAVPWILENVFDAYEYTQDTAYLRDVIYPMMREEAVFYDQYLVEDEDGKLVSAPAYSPEHGPYTMGNTYEQTLVWQLYENTIKAAEILGVDADKVAQWKENQANLKGPIEIGESGQIKEWYEETTVNSMPQSQGYNHRHLSHMLGLFPGTLISQDTPEWFAAARVSMENRTDSSTGWGMGQRINTWAHLRDGNKAYQLIGNLFKSGILTNLWDTHPPFQIDGNFGYTSGVAEMLLQSSNGYIDLLPALPDDWESGSVSGLVARGNYQVDMTWADCQLTDATVTAANDGTAKVQFPGASKAVLTDDAGNAVAVTKISDNRISFTAEAGRSYTFSQIPVTPRPKVVTVDDTDPSITYSAGWGDWKDAAHVNGTVKYTAPTALGTETISYTFTGTGIDVIAPKNKDRGFISVQIDGGEAVEIDTYADGDKKQQVLYSLRDLENGEHAITIKVLNKKRDGSTGTKVEFDAFKVYQVAE